MIKLKSLYKSIIKYPVSSGLNILSLIIAFSGIMTLILYVTYENSFDKYNKNFHSIYKIEIQKEGFGLPALMSGVIKKNIPEIEDITPFSFQNHSISIPESPNKNYGVDILFAKNSVFNIFTFPFTMGQKNQALTRPNTIVLTKKTADKLFGKVNPIGKKILLAKQSYTVTGVMENIPKTSSFTADGIASFKTLTQNPNAAANQWSEWSYSIFCKLSSNSNYKEVSQKINHIPEIVKQFAPHKPVLELKPMAKVHFSQGNYNYRTVSKTVLNILTLLAVILALMGIINFVNLSVSQATEKAKVFSVMRVLGAGRKVAIARIISESILISLIALVFAFFVHALIYHPIEEFFNIQGLGFSNRTGWYLYFAGMVIIYGIVAGLYPAFFISSSRLLHHTKGNSQALKKGQSVRNTLVVLQFIFSITLLIVSFGIAKQIHYWKTYNTGLKTKNVIYIPTTKRIRNHYKTFAREIMADSNVVQYSYSQSIPGSVGMAWGREINGQQVTLTAWPVDENFLHFFGIKIVKGRAFSQTPGADENKFIVNQKTVSQYGWKNPTKKTMQGFGFSGQIIGVVKNFNFSSLENSIQPMVFWLTNTRKYVLFLKLKPGNYTEALAHIKQVWERFEPVHGIYYRFLDNFLGSLYHKDERIARFINFVSLWTILLSLTGLLGIVLFTIRKKTKEIGIRKVNGATVSQIVIMLVKEFVKWVALAFIVAVPVAYYALNRWVENFAYKTPLSWWIFALAGIAVLIIAMATVSWQTFVAARKNPVESLRYE